MRYVHDVNSMIKKGLKALIWYKVFNFFFTFDALNRGRIVFFNGGNDDNLCKIFVLIKYNSFKSNVCQINVTPF